MTINVQPASPGPQFGGINAATTAARLERLPVGRWHRKLTVIVGIGAFYEYFEVFLGGVLATVLTPLWGLSTLEKASLIGSVFAGMFVGAIVLGRVADRVGRKKMFLINLSIYLVFSIIAAFSPNIGLLIVCRFLAGIGAGAEAALIPTYLGEFIPRHLRGRYIGYAFTLAFAAYPVVALAGAPLAQAHFFFEGWRWLLLLGASGIVALLWMRRNMPESPRWLVSVGRHEEAENELKRIETEVQSGSGRPLPKPDYSRIPALAAELQTPPKARVADLFRGQNARRMVAIGALWTIGVLGYYGFSSLAPMLLVDKGYTVTQSLFYTAVIAIGYPLGALTAAWVAERTERRTLVVVSALITGAAGLTFGFANAGWLIMFAGFMIGYFSNIHSSGVNMYASEVFPTRLRTTAIGLCYGTGRLFAMALPFGALPLLTALGGTAVLIGSAGLFTVTAVLVLIFGPRTTGRTLEDAAEDYNDVTNNTAEAAVRS